MLKQGWKSLKEAVDYIKNPQNKGKPIGILLLETGKIVIAGLTGIGAVLLGELIEKALVAIPVVGPILAVDIPLLGSLANIIGIFLGAVVAGIIGAIAINLIEKKIETKLKSDNIDSQIESGNRIIAVQHELQAVGEAKLAQTESVVAQNIVNRHNEAAEIMNEVSEEIRKNSSSYGKEEFEASRAGTDDFFSEMGVE